MCKLTHLMLRLPLAVLCLMATAAPALALNINLIFAPSVSDFGVNTNSMTSAVAYAAQQFDNAITDPITVNILVNGATGSSTFGASNYSYLTPYTYTQVLNALTANATQPAQQIAVANLPGTDPSPGGPNTYGIPTAEAKALGLLSASTTASDGSVTFGAGNPWAFNPNNRAVGGEADFIGLAQHELSEALGRTWGLGNGSDGRGYYVPLDLFRYDGGTNTRDMTNNTNVWFSINGGNTDLNSFNYAFTNSSGTDTEDPTDWGIGVANANYQNSLTNDAFNAYSASGVVNGLSSADLTLLNVMGFHLSTAAMSGGTWARNGNGSWTNASYWTYPVVPTGGTTTVFFAGVPANPSAPITVTLDGNQSAGALVFNVSEFIDGYTLAQGSGGALSLGTPSGGSITVVAGNHTISAPVTLEGPLTVNVAANYGLLVSGALSEANAGTSVTFNGPGALGLAGSNSFTGTTIIGGGTLSLLNTNALAGGGFIEFAGGTLQYSASNTRDYSSRIFISSAPVQIDTNGQNVTFASSLGNLDLEGLIKIGAGTLTLAASNGYLDGTAIDGGVLQVGNNSALGTSAGYLAVNSGTLDVHGYSLNVGALSGGGVIDNLSGNGTLTVGNGDASSTFSGTMKNTSGQLSLVKVGGGTIATSGNISLAGGITVNDGVLAQLAGTVHTSSGIILADNPGNFGVFALSGGSLLSQGGESIGYAGTGSFIQAGGTNSLSGGTLTVGVFGTGLYNLQSHGLLSAGTEILGWTSTGSITQSGGTNSVANNLYIGDAAFGFTGSGSYNLSGGLLSAPTEYLGDFGPGSFTQSQGTHYISNTLYLGYNSGASGAYNVSGGSLSAATEYIGYNSTGSFLQSGGTHNVTSLTLGYFASSSGSYQQYSSNGGLLSTLNEYIGYFGTGNYQQYAGTNAVGALTVGYQPASSGTYYQDGGTLSAGSEYVGFSGTGLFQQQNGTHTVTSELDVGYGTSGNGRFDLLAGVLNCQGNENIGYSGTGVFLQSGGNHNVSSNLSLGYTAQGNGTYVLGFPGSVLTAGTETIGYSGTGSFFQNGGTNIVTALYIALNGTGSGSYQLNAGAVLSAATETIGGGGNGLFYQNGGTNSVSGTLVLAASPFSFGEYNLYGGLLKLGGLTHITNLYSFQFGYGTLQAGSSFATDVPIVLGTSGSQAVFDSNGNTLTLNGFLFGNGGIQKAGAGTLILTSSSNSYSGPTTLFAGTLEAANGNQGSATAGGTVTLNGGVLAAGAAGGTITGPVLAGNAPHAIAPGAGLSAGQYGTLNLFGGLTTNAFTTLLYNLNLASSLGTGSNGRSIYGGDLINLGGSTLTVSGGNNQGGQIAFTVNPTQPGDYRLFHEAGGSPNLNGFNLPSQSGMAYVLSTAVDPNYIDLIAAVASAGASGGTWTSPVSGSWTTAADWSSNPQIPTSGTVTFPGAPGAPITVSLNGGQSAAALVFNVSNANGYTLAQGSGGALSLGTSTGAAITVAAGAHNISAPMVLEGNLTANIAIGASLQLSGIVSQAASGLGLTLNGPGVVLFSGTGAYSGNTTVNSGTLQIASGGLLPTDNEFVGTGAAAAYVVQNGGSNVVSAGGNLQGFIMGYGNGSAYYNLNGGLLNAANEFISYSGYSVFTQTAGTNQAGYLSVGTFYNGNYFLSGGLVSANIEDISDSALNGAFTQSGGTNLVATNLTVGFLAGGSYFMSAGVLSAVNAYVGYGSGGGVFQSGGDFSNSTALYVAYENRSQGNYYLSGSGLLSAPNEYVGYGGTGTFNQSGGTNSLPAGNLYLGYNPGGAGTYTLSAGVLDPVNEYVGGGGTGIFYQMGGMNTVTNVSVSGGYFLLSGGQLLGSGGTIGVVNGGFQSPGTLDLSGYAAVVAGTGALLDLSGNVFNTSGASLSVGSDSLLIVQPGFDPTTYASYSNQGMLHTLGSTLSVSSGTGFGGWGDIVDPVACQGTILATQGGWINLYNGLSLSDPGQVNLGTGTVLVNDVSFSGMTGGALTASLMVVGSNGTGSFPQSGGTSVLSTLYLGYNAADSGMYLLSGTAQLSVGYEFIGLGGSGTFTQTGGTHAVGTLYLAQEFGSAGTYNLNGGLLSLSALYQGGGAAAFNFSGGTFQAAAPNFQTSVPITLATAGSNGVFDTNGNALTLYGPLSGPGGLIVAGSGILTLAVSNSYTGTTLITNGTLALADSNALSGSTFDTSGSGALNLQGGIGGFAFGGLQGSGSLLLTDASVMDVALTIGGNNADTTFSGSLSDSNSGGSLTKVGTGTLVLAGTNTFAGGTFVPEGTLALTDPAGLLDGSNVTVGDPTMFPAPVVPAPVAASNVAPVPEPSTAALLSIGAIGLLGYVVKRSKSASRG